MLDPNGSGRQNEFDKAGHIDLIEERAVDMGETAKM